MACRGVRRWPTPNVRIPEEARDRLAAIAAAEGMSLRAYLARLAETLLTPAERADQARAALTEWTGYAPGPAEERDLDSERDRRLARAAAR
ncbi:hypothetical protein [Streptomyces sp. NPDC052107]|uniref:hypothetical protein n=1 Tax=Streptomyces sp. NPDC052107 TaxID=3155632 RepID=UPI00341DC565